MYAVEHKMQYHFRQKTLFFLVVVIQAISARCCMQHEREALLKFKADISDDPSNRLASWTGANCCNWAGVRCSNKTGHIIMLHLPNSYVYMDPFGYPDYNWNNHSLSGKISPSLLNISELQHLDLSYNNFSGNNFLAFISLFRDLNYLNLSSTDLSGIIHPQLGNLSKLQYLDLSSTDLLGIIPPQLGNLSKLQYLDLSSTDLSGIIPPQLSNLSKLQYLDLSSTDLSGIIPPQLGNLSKLQYLDLSSMDLSGIIPPQFGNISKLQYLYLSNMPNIYISDVWLLSHLTSLKYLEMFEVNFQDSREWVHALNTLPLLQGLSLSYNNLTTIPTSITGLKFSSLISLIILGNKFNSWIPDWMGKLTTLTTLVLWDCSFVGRVPNLLGNLTSLNVLSLCGNDLEGPMPPLHNLKNLTMLDIEGANIGEDIREVVNKLANDTLDKLEVLVLCNASLIGNLTGWVSRVPNLKQLYLSDNNLNGTIPIEISNLISLESLDLSENYFVGEASEAHLTGLSNLKHLSLNYNHINVTVNMNWVPPFQLDYLSLRGCKLGPHFPSWLQNQSQLSNIDISNTEIAEIVPKWFWNLRSLYEIDLSQNHLTGMLPLSLENLTMLSRLNLEDNQFEGGIPSLPRSVEYIYLSNNLFSGQLTTYVKTPNLLVLVLSNNSLNGTIEQLTCGLDSLTILNLAQNNLYGNLPSCWPNTLRAVNLAHNNLSGVIPSSMSSLNLLWILQLNNNNLTGELHSTLQPCQNLTVLDLGDNKFMGLIPEWIGESLKNLRILRLRSNHFSHAIPIQLVKLQYLQVLDLANNKLFGLIPQNMDSLLSMASPGGNNNNSDYFDFLSSNNAYYNVSVSVTMKDLNLEYTTSLSLLKSIDLSGNNLTGMIPKNITTLHGLKNLNLSNNHLTGPIPLEIGKIISIESLDLRINELAGMIPQGLANLNFLSSLNLSYNNLSGKIPIGNQLQTLDDPYIYVGNDYLCGPPLDKRCDSSIVNNSRDYIGKVGEDLNKVFLYLFVVLGFGCGFWVVFGVLIFKINWRYWFFHVVDNWFDMIYVLMVVYLGSVRK